MTYFALEMGYNVRGECQSSDFCVQLETSVVSATTDRRSGHWKGSSLTFAEQGLVKWVTFAIVRKRDSLLAGKGLNAKGVSWN